MLFINDVTDLGGKHTKLIIFNIKKVIMDWIVFKHLVVLIRTEVD